MTADTDLVAGRYRLHEQIGAGGMGTVWRATDTLLNRQVAIKRVRVDTVENNDTSLARERILREARIAAQLHHPNIVSLFDVIVVSDDPWLVMEYLPSRSLSAVLTDNGPLPVPTVSSIGIALADALAAAHAIGITHRDVKPGNVLLAANGTVKLTDFGISHAADDVVLTRTNVVSGTPVYLAPEVAAGEDSGPAADVYSLGITLYAAVEGAPPFSDGDTNVFRLLRRIAVEDVPPPRRAGPLTPVLLHMLDRQPRRRPSASDARAILRGIGPATSGPPAVRPVMSHPFPPAARRRRGLLWLGVALVVLLLTGAGVVAAPLIARTVTPPQTEAASTSGHLDVGPDPRTADPCSLTEAAPLATFGNARRLTDYDNLDTCRVEITDPAHPTAGTVIVQTFLAVPLAADSQPDGVQEVTNGLVVARQTAPTQGSCDVTIVLRDGYRVVVRSYLDGERAIDLCAVSGVGSATALRLLAGPGIQRRPPFPDAPNALAGVDTCAMLDDAAIAATKAFAAPIPKASPGFGHWSCTWGSGTKIYMVSKRIDLLTSPGDGERTPLAGRDVYVQPGGYDQDATTCQVSTAERAYTAVDDSQQAEVLALVFTMPGGSPTRLCQVATSLMGSVITRLPPAS